MEKNTASQNPRHTTGLNIVMACALLFLAVILGRSTVLQLISGLFVRGCISAVGALLSLGVSLMLGNDLRKQLKTKRSTQEEPHNGH